MKAQARIQERAQQAQQAEQAQARAQQAQQAQQAQRQAADRQKFSLEEPVGPLQQAQRQAQQMAMQERLPRSRGGEQGGGGGGGGRRDFDREREAARLAAHKRMLERPF